MKSEPLALMLYRRFLDGESVQQMAVGLSISEERIGRRIRAAALFYERQKTRQPYRAGSAPGPGQAEVTPSESTRTRAPERRRGDRT